MIATLGLSPLTYVPYFFLKIIKPIVSIIYVYTGIIMEKLGEAKKIIAVRQGQKNSFPALVPYLFPKNID